MLPLGFTDLAASPTIVMSPHQHQFDPISSRAAHSIYYNQPQKPLMPTRTWDHPIAMARAREIPQVGTRAQKRTRDEVEQDNVLEDDIFNPRTPNVSPENDTRAVRAAPTNQICNNQLELENQMQEKSGEAPKVLSEGAKANAVSPVKRQRRQIGNSDDDDENSEDEESVPWEVLLGCGYGWSAVDTTGNEGDIFRHFTDIIVERFYLPPHVDWLAKNLKDGLMLARISEGICYFDSSFSHCWRLALTSSEAKKKCEQGVSAKEACEELVLGCCLDQPGGEMRLRPYDSHKGHFEPPPIEWIGNDNMSWFDGVPRDRGQPPTPASDTYSRSASSGEGLPGPLSSHTVPEVHSKPPEEPATVNSFTPGEEMELD